MAASIRTKQIGALQRMLNFNVPVTKASFSEPQWKVLIYDKCGQNIISPLLTVRELRDMGVTLHLLLHSEREVIPDVPAIYFVLPSQENIARICKDLQNQQYESYYFNFISPISRQRLEDIAMASIQANVQSQVTKVFDQYLNFICLEDDMFSLQQCDDLASYYLINKGDVKDTEMDALMDGLVDGLFSFCVTHGQVPIIRSPRGNAAEMLAEKLDKKLRENLRDARNSIFTDAVQAGQLSFQRPLLVIADRNMDLATPFHHTWTYQALVHDVLDLRLNRVDIVEGSSGAHAGAKSKKKTYDLATSDRFWVTQKGSPFPNVAEAIQEELDSYKSQEEEVKRLKMAMGLSGEDDGAISMLSDHTARLTSAVSSLPELLEKKRLIDMHTNIATALLDQIKARKLDLYFETEEKLMSRLSLDRSILDIITDTEAGGAEDKVRLFLINLICGSNMTETEIDQYCTALIAAGCDISPVQYVRRWKAYAKLTSAPAAYAGGGTSTIGMFSKLMSTASSFAMEGVKNLVVKKHNLPLTKVVDQLMENKSAADTDDYRYFDPKLLRPADNSSVARSRTAFQEAIVFVVGGGNYIEYQNLSDYARTKNATLAAGSSKRIVYGCTDLLNASQFLHQLGRLGKEM